MVVSQFHTDDFMRKPRCIWKIYFNDSVDVLYPHITSSSAGEPWLFEYSILAFSNHFNKCDVNANPTLADAPHNGYVNLIFHSGPTISLSTIIIPCRD